MATDIKGTFVRFEPGVCEPILAISDKALLDEILLDPQFKSLKTSLNGDVFLEVPANLSGLKISPKLKSMLAKYTYQILCIST